MRTNLRLFAAALLTGASSASLAAQTPPFQVADSAWDAEALGNHRAVVDVTGPGRAVHAVLPWRRRDRHPEAKGVIVVDAATGAPVRNVRRGAIGQGVGEVDFEPVSGPGRYYVYYLPFKSGGRSNYPNVSYLPVETTADSSWLAWAAANRVPRVEATRFEAVDSLNSFWPMEVIATAEETAELLARHADEPYLIFPEDRTRSIRMRDQLPWRWLRTDSAPSVAGQARRGEFFAWQLGIFAIRPVAALRLEFSDLVGPAGAIIPKAKLVSINGGGVNWDGRAFETRVDVPALRVQPMWCGVQVPIRARPGRYRGTIRVLAEGMPVRTVPVDLGIGPDSVAAGGANEPEKLTRLAWLNSTAGQTNTVIAPYRPIGVRGSTLEVLGRRLTLAPDGLPAAIDAFFTPEMTGYAKTAKPILAGPVRFELMGAGGNARVRPRSYLRREPGTVAWTGGTEADQYQVDVRGELEFDGHLSYQIRMTARERLALADVRLVIPYAAGAARYAMGLGLEGQRRPATFDWHWDVARKNQDGAWLGDVNGGLSFSLRSDNYVRPLNTNFYLQKPLELPPSWGNQGRGGISWREEGEDVVVWATSGPRTMAAGESLRFDVTMLITPFHPIDPDFQWGHRFYHKFAPLDTVVAAGANVINVHHATEINPYINYPFIAHREMKAYIDAAHRRGLSVKIYNTVRELSNRAFETFAMRSLGHEIYSPGRGGGYAWLQEHLDDDYIAAWFVPELKDAAVINSGMSRWHNYYVEGINWLVQNVGIDGLYLDDVAFDRTTMKRVKRMLTQRGRPGIIDLHSANQYNERDGFINSAMLYLEHFPYLDRLWFGEYFDYQRNSPDFVLTEVSGIPFGLMGEMLEGGGNPWRGMIYGMTNRMPWSDNADPRPLWKVWDDFGIRGSRMLGYWAESVPVKTDRPDVLATVYRKPGRALVAIASWAPDTVTVRLKIDWPALGVRRATARLVAPAIAGLQEFRSLGPDDSLRVAPGQGAILRVEPTPPSGPD